MAWNGGRAYLARALTKKASVGHVKDVDLTRHGITPQKGPTIAASHEELWKSGTKRPT